MQSVHNNLKIAVLKGGISNEREVSLNTGAAVAKALRGLGHEVEEIDVKAKNFDLPSGLDFVFIGLHGAFGEDGQVQKILTDKKMRFNGSGAEASASAFDKSKTYELARRAGVPVPASRSWKGKEDKMDFPFILKPVCGGSTIGVFWVHDEKDVSQAFEGAASFSEPMLIEQLIEGMECTVGILGDEALPVIEIKAMSGRYDYHDKYTPGASVHVCPVTFAEELEKKIQAAALAAHRAVGCEVYSRVDVMVDKHEHPYVIDVNTIPGMTGTSLLPDAASVVGLSYAQLCQRIIDLSWDVKR